MLREACAFREVVAVMATVGALGACTAIAGVELPKGPPAATEAGDDGIDVPKEIAFPADSRVFCNAASQRRPFTITNRRSKDVSYKLTLTGHGTFSLVDATDGSREGTLSASANLEVTIEAKGVVPGKQTAELVMTFDGTTRVVPITAEVRGASIVVTPSFLDVGEIPEHTNGPSFPLELRNDGNEGVTLSGFTQGRPEFEVSPSSVFVPAGGTASVNAYLTTGAAADLLARELTLAVEGDDALCGAAPVLKLQGRRVTTSNLVSPLSADFGDVPCGGAPAIEKTFTLRSGSIGAGYTAVLALGASSRFTVVEPSGDILPSQTKDVHVRLKEGLFPAEDLPPEDLTIQIGSTPRTIKLFAHGYGAKLSVEPVTSSDALRIGETQLFKIRNAGNARTCVKFTKAKEGFVAREVGFLNPGDDNIFGVQFVGSGIESSTTIAITKTPCDGKQRLDAPICEPAPKPLTVTGQR